MAETGTPDIVKMTRDAMEAYEREVQEALHIADPKLQRQAVGLAQTRFLTSLRNGGASDAVVKGFEDFLKNVQGKEVEGIGALIDATKGRIQNLQGLQKEQAELMMGTLTAPDKAVSGIASFAMTLSTICRFFGADDFAQMIEDKSRELMDGVHDRLKGILDKNSKEYAVQHDESTMLADTIEEVSRRFQNSKAPQVAADMAHNNAPQNLPTPIEPYANPLTQSPDKTIENRPLSASEFRKNLISLGLSADEAGKFMPAFGKSMGLDGEKVMLDSQREARSIIDSPQMKALPAEKAQAVTKFLLENVPA